MISIKSNVVADVLGKPGELVFLVHTQQGASYKNFVANGNGCKIRLEGGFFSDDSTEKTISSSSTIVFKDSTNDFYLFIDSLTLSEVKFNIFGDNTIKLLKGKISSANVNVGAVFGEGGSVLNAKKHINYDIIADFVCSAGDSFVANDSILFDLADLRKMPNLSRIIFRNQKYVHGNIKNLGYALCSNIDLRNVNVWGNIGEVKSLSIEQLNVSLNPKIGGNIEDFFVNNVGRTDPLTLVWGGSSSYPIRWHGASSGGNIRTFVASYDGDNIVVAEGGSTVGTYDGASWSYT